MIYKRIINSYCRVWLYIFC